jgi:CheY-like chemotaxis protein
VCIEVRDSGIGMTREVRGRVFEPFFTTKAAGGTGLGLAITQGIVRRRGGQISVRSSVGTGATFTVDLPVVETDGQSTSPVVDGAAAPVASRGRRILVVDDEPGLAQLLQRVLESHGYIVTPSFSAVEALGRFDPAAFDLVISDYAMPGGNGLELAAAIHERSPGTPMLLMTAWGSGLDMSTVPPHIVGVVTKPYRLAEVIEAVDAALAHGSRRE